MANMNKVNKELVIKVVASGLWRAHTFKSLDNAIRYCRLAISKFPNCEDATIVVNGIFMPSIEEDETFFYASVEAAKDGKVWVEEAHAFMSQEFKSTIEGGCVDINDLDEEFAEEGGWYSFVRENIYQDIFGYKPMTGGEGVAIVYDKDVAEMAELDGYDVLPCVKFDKEEGEIPYWKIFAKDDENEYYEASEEVPSEAFDEDENGHRVYVEPEPKSLEFLDDDMRELFTSFAEDQDDFDPDYKGTLYYKNGKWMRDNEYEATCKAEAKKFVEAHREELRDAFTRMAVIGYLSGI